MSEPEKKKKKKKKAKGTCRALHDYEKQNPDELSFAQDDIITIVNDKNEGWWIGRLPSGDEGWFPVNFTEIVDAPKKKKKKPTKAALPDVDDGGVAGSAGTSAADDSTGGDDEEPDKPNNVARVAAIAGGGGQLAGLAAAAASRGRGEEPPVPADEPAASPADPVAEEAAPTKRKLPAAPKEGAGGSAARPKPKKAPRKKDLPPPEVAAAAAAASTSGGGAWVLPYQRSLPLSDLQTELLQALSGFPAHVDATLTHVGGAADVHACLVAARAPGLVACLDTDSPAESDALAFAGAEAINALLAYVYADVSPSGLSPNGLVELLGIACRFEIERLRAVLQTELSTTVTLGNVLDFLALANTHELADLQQFCIYTVTQNRMDAEIRAAIKACKDLDLRNQIEDPEDVNPYAAIDVPPSTLRDDMAALAEAGFEGGNVTFVASDGEVRAHAVVLAARSATFAGLVGGSEKTIDVSQTPAETVKAYLRFVCTNVVGVPAGVDLLNLYADATTFNLDPMAEAGLELIVSTAAADDVLATLKFFFTVVEGRLGKPEGSDRIKEKCMEVVAASPELLRDQANQLDALLAACPAVSAELILLLVDLVA